MTKGLRPLEEGDLKDQIYQKYLELPNQVAVAKALDIPHWTVRRAMMDAPEHFRQNIVKAAALDTLLACFQLLTDRLPTIQEKDIPWLWRNMESITRIYHGIVYGMKGQTVGGTNIQNVINLGQEEAKNLRETIDSVDGEVVDNPDD